MRMWILLFGTLGLVAACGDGEIGDDCGDDDDCEEGLICDFDDPAAEDDDGICREPGDTDDGNGNGDDDDDTDTDTDGR